MPAALVENALFGCAQAGACVSEQAGALEQAEGGILFLDEVGALPLSLQGRLLRVLQERSFRRPGSLETIPADIRVIAAASRPLPELVAQRLFREDLYYRLNVIHLAIPPLRLRREDIPLLAGYFIEQQCRLLDKRIDAVSPAVMHCLTEYAWPGNGRELENCLEYMVAMAETSVIGMDCLPVAVQETLSAQDKPGWQSEQQAARQFFTGGDIVPLAELERLALRHALTVFGDSSEAKRKAAAALGIGTATLYRKLKKLTERTAME